MSGAEQARQLPPHRPLAIGGVSAAVFVAFFVLAPSLVQAKPILLVKPPFLRATSGSSNSTLSNTTCKRESLPVGPTANITNGELRVKTFASANRAAVGHPGCRASVSTMDWFEGPAFHVRTSGPYHVIYNWNISWNMTSTCNGILVTCSNSSSAEIRLFANVYDNTTGAWVLAASFEKTVYRILGPGSGAGYNWTFSLRLSPALNSKDHYLLYTGLSTASWARSGCISAGCFSSSTTIDVGDHPLSSFVNGAWLDSMIVS